MAEAEEKGLLPEIEKNLQKYSSEEPNAMKYVEALWERSSYLADVDAKHLKMLETLKPLTDDWVAELSRIAADLGKMATLTAMKSGSRDVQDPEDQAVSLSTLCQRLSHLQSGLEKIEESESEKSDKFLAAEDGCHRIAEAMKYIEKFVEKQPESEKEMTAATAATIQKAKLLLESSVETVLISKLGSLKFPVAKHLGELWKFPSDHPPIAAALTLGKHSIKVASWNVLNRNYYKYIEQDTQGLKGSEITTYHEAGTRENKIIEKIQEMLQKDFHVLCLQECWPELLEQLKGALGGHHEMECSGQEQDKNQEAIVYNTKLLKKLNVVLHAPHIENPKKVVTEALLQVMGETTLRVVTVHMPGAPFGPARREFADCLASMVSGAEKLPTVLLGDLNFPEKAVYPLLMDRGLEDMQFVPISYPTNICQGSLLPKRIDSIAVINHQEGTKLQAEALEADEIMEGLGQVVELLSRSAEI